MSKSEQATKNIAKLTKLVKARLNSSGKAKTVDDKGNVTYVDHDIFSYEMIADFLTLSLSDFNQTPYFTNFTFDNSDFVATFAEVLVMGAALQALASQALIERGREFVISDNGISFSPPTLSEMLNTQYCTLLNSHAEKLRIIKLDKSINKFAPKKNK
jgi:hypothetical protein